MVILKGLGSDLTGVDGTKLDPSRLATLEDILKQAFGASTKATVVRRFESKKNVVLQLRIEGKRKAAQTNMVAKLFVTDRFEIELQLLNACHERGPDVPEVLAGKEGVILMSFISGELLVEAINRTFDSGLIDTLVAWYYEYHTLHKLTKGDPKLKNFIYNDGVIFGIDFEESRPGDWMLDIGGIAASLLDTTPVFDKRKRILAWHLLEQYLRLRNETRNHDIDHTFLQTVSSALKETAHWRKDNSLLLLAESVSRFGIPIE